jgi:hypothetical protein
VTKAAVEGDQESHECGIHIRTVGQINDNPFSGYMLSNSLDPCPYLIPEFPTITGGGVAVNGDTEGALLIS